MRRRITIEIDAEDCAVEEMTQNIEATALGQIAGHQLSGFSVRREDLPERISPELRVPSFLVNRPFREEVCVK